MVKNNSCKQRMLTFQWSCPWSLWRECCLATQPRCPENSPSRQCRQCSQHKCHFTGSPLCCAAKTQLMKLNLINKYLKNLVKQCGISRRRGEETKDWRVHFLPGENMLNAWSLKHSQEPQASPGAFKKCHSCFDKTVEYQNMGGLKVITNLYPLPLVCVWVKSK